MIKATCNKKTATCKLEAMGTSEELLKEFGVITQFMFENFSEDLIIELVSTAAASPYGKKIATEE